MFVAVPATKNGLMTRFGEFRLDGVNQCLSRPDAEGREERLLLKPKPFAALRYLVERAGRLVTHDEPPRKAAVWPDIHVQLLKRHVFDLRQALGDDPKAPVFLETLPRRGYQFIAPVHDGERHEFGATESVRLVGRDRSVKKLDDPPPMAVLGRRMWILSTRSHWNPQSDWSRAGLQSSIYELLKY